MIPDPIKKLVDAHRRVRDRLNFNKSLRHINVSKVATLAGSTYETVRNSIELEQDHLLRRRAIRRILLRIGALRGGKASDIAEDVLKEIVWAKYTKNLPVPELAIEAVGKTIQKHQLLVIKYHNKFKRKLARNYAEDMYDILSFEIERVIAPYYEKDQLVNIQFNNLKMLNLAREHGLSDKASAVQTYINVIRSVNKFDNAMIKFYMFNNAFNSWGNPSNADYDTIIIKLTKTLDDINVHINHKIGNRKYKEFIRQAIPLKILNTTIEDNLDNAEDIIGNKSKRDEHVKIVCDKEYSQTRKKVRITVVKTFIYLAVTKMVFALLVEVPYELSQEGAVNYVSLAINIIFPAILMVILATSFKIPSERNTQAIIEVIDRLVDPAKGNYINNGLARNRQRPILHFIFKVFSNIVFLAIITGIAYGLRTYLHFNPVSISIFILFLSLISFGALKTRNVATELIIVPVRANIFAPLIDTVATPILGLGKALSEGVSKLSPIPLFLDYVIEAPFKGILMIFEEWNSFVKNQREDIV